MKKYAMENKCGQHHRFWCQDCNDRYLEGDDNKE